MEKQSQILEQKAEKQQSWENNVAPHSKHYNAPIEDRKRWSQTFGPNWASVLAGHGDQ